MTIRDAAVRRDVSILREHEESSHSPSLRRVCAAITSLEVAGEKLKSPFAGLICDLGVVSEEHPSGELPI